MHSIHRIAKRPHSPDDDNNGGPSSTPQNSLASFLDTGLKTICNSSSAFLITSSPVQSTSAPPGFTPIHLSPSRQKKARYSNLLATVPSNVLEEELQNSMRELLAKNKQQKSQLIMMQSTLVLNGAYCDLVRGQLAAQEQSKTSKQKGRLVGDGMPRLLTSSEFVRRVEAFHADAAIKEAELSERRATRVERNDALVEWKALESRRKEENKAIRVSWQADVKAWEEERDRAKALGKRPSYKPTLKGQLFSPVPKPQLAGNNADLQAPLAGPSKQTVQARRPDSLDDSDSEDEESEPEDTSEEED
ncbi:hypothetical protein C8R43DRAFT_887278 [Mycena crocata]|nr:hypothetical protein C8R43DRAFT_887278 [Mycena crocata]